MLSVAELKTLHSEVYSAVENYRNGSEDNTKFANAAAEYRNGSNHNYAPFHVDLYNLSLIHHLIQKEGVNLFCELGTYFGGSAYYVGNLLNVETHTCEPLKKHYTLSSNNLANEKNIHLYNQRSLDFLQRDLVESTKTPLFYVDSHGYGFDLELKEEIDSILSKHKRGFILIDDFKIPERPQFGFEQNVELFTIQPILEKYNMNTFYVSDQTEQTSPIHGLRGYILICIDNKQIDLPPCLKMRHLY